MRDIFLSALREKHDEVRGTNTYMHRDTTDFVNTRSEVYCYYVKGDGEPTLRMQIQYVADDWLFIRRFIIKADDETFAVEPDRLRGMERDNGDGKIWEWHDRPVSETEMKMLTAMTKAKRVILRCEGDQYKKDRDVSPEEISRIQSVLVAYQIVKAD